MASNKVQLSDLGGGLNRDFPAHVIQPNELARLENCVYRQGVWTKRGGYTEPNDVISGTHNVIEFTDYLREDGTERLYAGTVDGIEELSGTSWTNRLNLGTTRGNTDKWFFAEVGDSVYAINGLDSLYTATTGGFTAVSWDTTTDAGGIAGISFTTAKIVLAMNSRLWFFNTQDATNGTLPYGVLWTEVNDFNRIETPNLLNLDDDHTPIVSAGVLINNFIAVYKRNQVIIIQNTGNPVASIRFKFPIGILGPKAWAPMPNGHMFASEEGLFLFSGGQPTAIGDEEINSYFLDTMSSDPDDQENIYMWTDRRHREVYIHYPTGSSEPDKYLVYNWQYDNWAEGDFTAWCGFYRFRGSGLAPKIYFGSSSGVLKEKGTEGSGATDNSTAITTKLRTKSFTNAPLTAGTLEFKDYIQVQEVITDALPTTTTVKIGHGDFGTEAPTFPSSGQGTITATDGFAPRADVEPVAGRYVTVEMENFDTVSELQIPWVDAGET